MKSMLQPSETAQQAPIKTDGIRAILRLSETSIECSSYIAIRGVRGSGKTETYRALTMEWTKLKSPPVAYYYQCMHSDTSYEFIRELVQHITEQRFKPRENPDVRSLIEMVQKSLAENEASFLFLDDIGRIDDRAWEMVRMIFEAVRQKRIKLGMAVTDLFATPQFRDGKWYPALLDMVHLQACSRDFMVALLTQLEPRLNQFSKAYFRGEEEALRMADILMQRTRGNFRAIDSLLRTLRVNLGAGQAVIKQIRRCLALRVEDPACLQLQFRLES